MKSLVLILLLLPSLSIAQDEEALSWPGPSPVRVGRPRGPDFPVLDEAKEKAVRNWIAMSECEYAEPYAGANLNIPKVEQIKIPAKCETGTSFRNYCFSHRVTCANKFHNFMLGEVACLAKMAGNRSTCPSARDCALQTLFELAFAPSRGEDNSAFVRQFYRGWGSAKREEEREKEMFRRIREYQRRQGIEVPDREDDDVPKLEEDDAP